MRGAFYQIVAICLLAFGSTIRASDNTPEAPAKPEAEKTIRARFVLSYTAAQTPEAKAAAVKSLAKVSERESLRLLAGMLGDSVDAVRIAACQTMVGINDSEGYLVKPLMGALTDSSVDVRIAAAGALANATIKADAIKALTYALLMVAGRTGDDANQKIDKNSALLIVAYSGALEKLTQQKSAATDAHAISVFWTDYWKQNEDALRAKDRETLGAQPVPERSKDAKPDSFDVMEAKRE
jgi:hypothetical protein